LAAKKRANGIIGDDEFEDDGNYGSAATLDVEVLQAISKRVHYGMYSHGCYQDIQFMPTQKRCPGKFVSESKFIDKPSAFIPHIQNPNRSALEALITKPEVELKLLHRLRKKAATYAQDFAPDGETLKDSAVNGSSKIDVDGVVDLYESYIIPLTKEIEVNDTHILAQLLSLNFGNHQVDYLLHRLDGLTQDEIDELAKR
jgi:chorismate mutase